VHAHTGCSCNNCDTGCTAHICFRCLSPEHHTVVYVAPDFMILRYFQTPRLPLSFMRVLTLTSCVDVASQMSDLRIICLYDLVREQCLTGAFGLNAYFTVFHLFPVCNINVCYLCEFRIIINFTHCVWVFYVFHGISSLSCV